MRKLTGKDIERRDRLPDSLLENKQKTLKALLEKEADRLNPLEVQFLVDVLLGNHGFKDAELLSVWDKLKTAQSKITNAQAIDLCGGCKLYEVRQGMYGLEKRVQKFFESRHARKKEKYPMETSRQ